MNRGWGGGGFRGLMVTFQVRSLMLCRFKAAPSCSGKLEGMLGGLEGGGQEGRRGGARENTG